MFYRHQTGREEVWYGEVDGLESTLRQIEHAIQGLSHTNRTVGYESFYIATRSTKTSESNIRGATHVIGWLEGQYALNRLGEAELVHQSPAQRTPKIITPEVVAAVLGEAPTGHRHAMDAARHMVRWLVSTKNDSEAKGRYLGVLDSRKS